MAQRSPTAYASQHSDMIDPYLPGEYPILLGDALREPRSKALSLNLRFNWKTRKLSPESRMVVTKTKTGPFSTYNLIVDNGKNKEKPYTYAGHIVTPSNSGNDGPESSPVQALALVYDNSKSAFVLEPISDSLDFNLKSAHNQTQQEVDAHPKLAKTASSANAASPANSNGPEFPQDDSDDQADPDNPYDYRHFLSEARENHAKLLATGGSRTPIPGNRTPVLGSRTPLSGMSPVPSASRFLSAGNSSTPSTFHATSGPSPKKRKVEPAGTHAAKAKPKPKSSRPRKASDPHGAAALSKERILDSDEELDNSVVVVLPPAGHNKHPIAPNHRTQLRTLNERPSSPHVVVSDADAELEIDMGSPPPTTTRRRPGVDPEAFRRRIHTHTPSLGDGGMATTTTTTTTLEQSRGGGGGGDGDGDIETEDADVEALELGSPRSGPASSRQSMHGGRIERVDADVDDDVDDDDDEDELAAELEAALKEEEEAAAAEAEAEEDDHHDDGVVGLGLGIVGSGARKVDEEEESEVSEEE